MRTCSRCGASRSPPPKRRSRKFARLPRVTAAKNVSASACRCGRSLRLLKTQRGRAESILQRAKDVVTASPNFTRRPKDPRSIGSQRLLAEADKGHVVDKRLLTGLT